MKEIHMKRYGQMGLFILPQFVQAYPSTPAAPSLVLPLVPHHLRAHESQCLRKRTRVHPFCPLGNLKEGSGNWTEHAWSFPQSNQSDKAFLPRDGGVRSWGRPGILP